MPVKLGENPRSLLETGVYACLVLASSILVVIKDEKEVRRLTQKPWNQASGRKSSGGAGDAP
jgi:hypothetical protein